MEADQARRARTYIRVAIGSSTRAFRITDLILLHKRNKITPDEYERYRDEILGRSGVRISTIDPVQEGEVGPNNYRIGYTKEGMLSGYLTTSIRARSVRCCSGAMTTISWRLRRDLGKVWWNRHLGWRSRVKSGEETLTADQKPLFERAEKEARLLEQKYGRKNLEWNDFEWGLLCGRLSALAWVMGANWESCWILSSGQRLY